MDRDVDRLARIRIDVNGLIRIEKERVDRIAEIATLKAENKRLFQRCNYLHSEIRKYQADAVMMQGRVDGMVEMVRKKCVDMRESLAACQAVTKDLATGQKGAFMAGWRYGRGSDSDDCPAERSVSDWDEFLAAQEATP